MMRHIENCTIHEDEESAMVERDMERCRILKEQSETPEGQARMWRQLDEYSEVVKNMNTSDQAAELMVGKQRAEFFQAMADFIKKERNIPIPTIRRTLETVAATYDLSSEELKEILEGKKVLDVGSADSKLFQEAKEKKINTEIVSLDIESKLLVNSGTDSGVQAMGEKMPFLGEKFDLVIAIYSIPYWANSTKSVEDFMDESLRVTKKNGEIYISPITDILSRPSLEKGNFPEDLESMQERDWKVQEVLKAVQLRFIEVLKKLKEEGVIEVRLGKNFSHEMKYQTPEKIDNSAPSIAFIKKLN